MSGSTIGPSFLTTLPNSFLFTPPVPPTFPFLLIDINPNPNLGVPPLLRISWKPVVKPNLVTTVSLPGSYSFVESGAFPPGPVTRESMQILPDVTNAGATFVAITDPTIVGILGLTVSGPYGLNIRATWFNGTTPSIPWPNGL